MKPTRLLGALLLACALPLGSCAKLEGEITTVQAVYTAVTTATVTQAKAKALHDTIYGVEGTATGFLETPPCNAAATATSLCKNVAIALKALRGADDTLANAIVAAQGAGTGIGVTSTAYNAAVTAFNGYSDAKAGKTPAAS